MDFNLMVMPRQIEPQFLIPKLVVSPYSTLAKMTSVCILAALEFQSLILLGAMLKIKVTSVILTKRAMVSDLVESRLPEIVRDRETETGVIAVDKIDLTDSDDVKFSQRSGKGKKGGKKVGKGKAKEGRKKPDQDERKKEEEERLKKWNEDWDRKLKAQEALDDVPCCSADGLFLKPKTQSNIWIKVTKDKATQDVQMAFMHVPVPRPKPPPLPKMVRIQTPDVPKPVDDKKKSGKKKGKGKKK